jgi:starch synthase (maltosyl-transferring)
VDTSLFDQARPACRDALAIPEQAFLALFVGRLEPQKGVSDLIAAAERVVSSQPDWHLAIVGDGPERGELVAESAAIPSLAGHVHWLGRRNDVPSLLKAADLFVLPSHWEGMPNVVLEAMAAGRAVVATSLEGTEDLVVNAETGWLVAPGDREALAAALVEAATNRQRTQHFGASGRRRVEARFTLHNMITAYDRLWADILGFVGPEAGSEPL